MPKYRITGPDGATYEVTAPDGATEQDVLAYAQANYQPKRADFSGVSSRARSTATAAPQQPPIDPTEGMSFGENLAAGFGKAFVDTGVGLKQLGLSAADHFLSQNPAIGRIGGDRNLSSLITGEDNSLRGRVRQESAETQREIDERRRLDEPLMNTGGGLVGNIGGQIAQMAVPLGAAGARAAGAAGRLAPYAAASGRAGAFAATQPMATGQSRANEVATSAALGVGGQALASGVSRVAARAKDKLAPAVRESIQMAERAGIPLHLAQVTDSRFLKGLSSVVNNLPFTGGGKAAERQQEAFNRAIGRSFGADDAATLSDDVMQGARSRIGAVYDDIYSRNVVKADDELLSKLGEIEQKAARNLPPNEAAIVKNQIDDILEAAGDAGMPGRQYQAFRTDRLLPMEGGPRSFQTGLIRDIRKALDDAAARSVGTEDAKALSIARRQYRNMRTADKALSQVAGSQGNVRPAALWPIVNQRGGSTQEMRELAKIGQNVLKDPIPNSGTPERDLILRLLGLGGGGALAGLALPQLAGGAAAGIGVGRLMNSPLAARMLGQGRPMSGLARLVQPAPRLLPAAAPQGMVIDVAGGTPGDPITQEELERLRQR